MKTLGVILILLGSLPLFAQCRNGQCFIPPPTFLYGWEKMTCNCTPSRTELFNRLIRCKTPPNRMMDIFTPDEVFHLKQQMQCGNRPKALFTWMIVSNGEPLPNMVKKCMNPQEILVVEQQLFRYKCYNTNMK